MKALLDTYDQFRELLPSSQNEGAEHPGEDGRYVEYLLKEYLKKYLPKDLEVLTGFILRPAVVCGEEDKRRKKDDHENSGQLDIIVYDSAHYPVYQRFGDNVIVPPEGVIGIISVKKHLRIPDIKTEIQKLRRAIKLCPFRLGDKTDARIPFFALVTLEDKIDETLNAQEKGEKVFENLKKSYEKEAAYSYEEMIDYIGSLNQWGIYKERPKKEKKETHYLFFQYNGENKSLGLQMILQNLLSVYYSRMPSVYARPGFIDNSASDYDKLFGPISFEYKKINRKKREEKKK